MSIQDKINKKLEKELSKEKVKANKKNAKANLEKEKLKPEYWYKEGSRCDALGKSKKAIENFKKAADMGNEKAVFRLADLYQRTREYSKAREYYKKAVELDVKGAKEAYETFEEFYEKIKDTITLAPAEKIHATYKYNNPLFGVEYYGKDKYIKFIQQHTFSACPACRGEIDLINHEDNGVEFTMSGKTIIDTFKCSAPECGLEFKKYTTMKAEYRKKSPSWKDMLFGRDSDEEERVEIVTIEHIADKNKVGKDVISILKMGDGEFIRK